MDIYLLCVVWTVTFFSYVESNKKACIVKFSIAASRVVH